MKITKTEKITENIEQEQKIIAQQPPTKKLLTTELK